LVCGTKKNASSSRLHFDLKNFLFFLSTLKKPKLQKKMSIIDGSKIADEMKNNLKDLIHRRRQQQGVRPPCLAIILVGDRKDSAVYIRMKETSAKQIGMNVNVIKNAAAASQSDVEKKIDELNNSNDVDGIIVQLPLPDHMDAFHVTQCVTPDKDVDGYHPLNMGHLFMNTKTRFVDGYHPLNTGHLFMNTKTRFISCTAQGIMVLLNSTGIELRGKKVVLIGTGTVGKPLAMLLLQQDATVLCCNKHTTDIQNIAMQGDVVIAAAGCPHLVKKNWIKPGAVVIDVGINSIRDSTRKSGYRLVGDVDFDEVSQVASWITPVPGGVGPMTVLMLLSSVIESWSTRIPNT
jgi:5,10-methylene-tetrahydrofolate dehydrogenase/methenyl tetrahydrofolate cyclohydrolase